MREERPAGRAGAGAGSETTIRPVARRRGGLPGPYVALEAPELGGDARLQPGVPDESPEAILVRVRRRLRPLKKKEKRRQASFTSVQFKEWNIARLLEMDSNLSIQ